MSSLNAKDRASLCRFTFSDGRRCRTFRAPGHPDFCSYHAQKLARDRTAESLGNDLAYFFSGDYLSACDLAAAIGRLLPALARGHVTPRTARTMAYLFQILVQTIRLAQHEYINAFDTDAWRDTIANSVKHNLDHRFPPDPKPEDKSQDEPDSHSGPDHDPGDPGSDGASSSAPQPPAPPSSAAPVGASLSPFPRSDSTRDVSSAPPTQPAADSPVAKPALTATPRTARTDPRVEQALAIAAALFPPRSRPEQNAPPKPQTTTANPPDTARNQAPNNAPQLVRPRRRRPASGSPNPFRINIYNPTS